MYLPHKPESYSKKCTGTRMSCRSSDFQNIHLIQLDHVGISLDTRTSPGTNPHELMASEVMKHHLTLHSPGCCSCSFACSVPGWVEASEPRTAASSSPAASSASRCPPSASRPAPAAWTEPHGAVAQAESATTEPASGFGRALTWWGSGRRIRPSTARWRRLRAVRWWSGPDAGGPACFCPCTPSSPAWPEQGGDHKWIAENKQWWLCAFKTHLFDKELLAHGHALAEPLLVALQHLLLLIHLSPQITVSLPTAAII